VRLARAITLASLAVIAALPAATGCGGDDPDASDEEQVRLVVQAYGDAIAAKDAETACQFLTDDPGCVQATEEEISKGAPFGGDFGRVRSVRIEGGTARVDFIDRGFVVLSRTDGGWRIGAPADEAAKLGAPEPPKTEPCSPKELQRLREAAGAAKGEKLQCARASVADE
jgi:hypothetical protein